MLNQPQMQALAVLYQLARQDRPADVSLVAAALGRSCVQADRLLAELDGLGLVDADRARLTMAGLALAVSARPAKLRRKLARYTWRPAA